MEWLANPVAIKVMPDAEPSERGDADEPRGTRGGVDQAAEEQAFEDWRKHKLDDNKRGNQQFFLLACRLRNAGRSHIEIEQILNVEYEHGRHPKMRRRQIKSITETLRKDRRPCSVNGSL